MIFRRILYVILYIPALFIQSFYGIYLLITNLIYWIVLGHVKYTSEELISRAERIDIEWLINVDNRNY